MDLADNMMAQFIIGNTLIGLVIILFMICCIIYICKNLFLLFKKILYSEMDE